MSEAWLVAASNGSGAGPFGGPVPSVYSRLRGVVGAGRGKNVRARRAAGATEKDIEELRKLGALHPQFGRMHPDMTITGNEAVCSGIPTAEYRFFAVHRQRQDLRESMASRR